MSEHECTVAALKARVAELEQQLEETERRYRLLFDSLVTDANEEKRTEGAPRSTEWLYRSIAANLPNGAVFVVDPNLRYILAEGEALRKAGFQPGDLEGRTLSEALGSDLADFYEPYYRQALDGRPFELEHESHGQSYVSRGTPLYRADGGLYGVLTLSYDITKRKKMEEALRRSERTYRDIAHHFPNGAIYIFDRDMRYHVADGEGLPLIGYDQESLEGKTVHDLDPEIRALLEPRYRRVLAGEKLEFETEFRGRFRRSQYVPIHNDQGQVVMGMVVGLDITEQRLAEAALRQSEQLYRELVQNANSAIIRWDKDGRIIFFNEYAQAFFGYGQAEILGRHISLLVPETESNGRDLSGLVRDIVNHPERYTHNVNENVCRDGRRVWMTWTNKAVFDESGRVREILAVGSDITELRQTQTELREARDEAERRRVQLEAALDSSPMGAIFYNPDHQITYLNPAAERLVGFTLAELERLPAEKRINLFNIRKADGGVPSREELIGYRALGGEVIVNEEFLVLPRHTEKYVHLLSHAAPIRMPDDTIIGAVQTVADITELIEARLEAERANQAKSVFLANMSHELRTPLSGVLGLADVLSRRVTEAKERQYVQLIIDSAKTLTELLTEVLDFSKIEAQGLELLPAPFDIREEIQKVVSLYNVPAEKKGNRLNFKIEAKTPRKLVADSGRLSQVLRNLVSNAVKFTEKGRIDLAVRMLDRIGDQAIVQVEVSDTGRGIPDDKQDRVFETFYQAEDHLTKEQAGTGLGLAITQRIVEAMNGYIRMDSQEGRGTSFFVDLPMAVAKDEPSPEENAAGLVSSPLEDRRVLLVEDNQVNIIYMEEMLRDLGCAYRVATTGREAVDLVRDEPFDLVLMDIQMPDMDGYTAMRRIREMGPSERKLPIIATTAYVSASDIDRALAAGADAHISKPVRIEKLIEKMRELLPGEGRG